MLSTDRDNTRQVYFDVWQRMQQSLPLDPMQQMIADIIALHPEYHALLSQPDASRDKDFLPEAGQTNPFLHMGMHIAILEQVSVNQPAGIAKLYQKQCRKKPLHDVHHAFMECLITTLWESQANLETPDMNKYLQCLRQNLR